MQVSAEEQSDSLVRRNGGEFATGRTAQEGTMLVWFNRIAVGLVFFCSTRLMLHALRSHWIPSAAFLDMFKWRT